MQPFVTRTAWAAALRAGALALLVSPAVVQAQQPNLPAFQQEIQRGTAATQRGRFDLALIHYQRAHAFSQGDLPRMGISAGLVGATMEKLGRLQEALQWYEAALRWLPPNSPNRPPIAASVARIRAQLGQPVTPQPQPMAPQPQPMASDAPRPDPLAPAPEQPEAEESGGIPTWAWIGGGSLLAVGAGVGIYFLVSGSGDSEIPYDAPDGVIMTP